MKRFSGYRIGIAQGESVLFSDFATGGAMWEGEGPRQTTAPVTFAEPFRSEPAVHVTLTMWDVANSANARIDVSAADVRCDGFVILFRTWGDTRVARVRVGWLAIGPVRDDEDWEVG
ncbi:H-type lectin domain-containing protein [Rubellimicrobium sp. CFH 75288]|uniref:H-type lectin domain-containing protein n=1 Tax=Rubellimicrobium sp. CFH 75288 TaxID=2697034 RepID=UPI001412B21D|nr:H-type lectin domain-containing protein [Rubellimicrobium sp. CFH 75288]NAZ36514.1 hypothetical protein [Rubellimicrobium sp. CFH 75288]